MTEINGRKSSRSELFPRCCFHIVKLVIGKMMVLNVERVLDEYNALT